VRGECRSGEDEDEPSALIEVARLLEGFLAMLPTLTMLGLAAMTVLALALLRNVEPTLKVLLAGLGGLAGSLLYFS
jgi:hypothetical protein